MARTLELVANADAALYHAKAEERGSIRFFEPDMDKRLREKRALQHDLGSAIAGNELELYYQPQALIDGEIIGFEALVRWHHPSRGMISPGSLHPAGRGERPHRPDRRMDSARGLPRGGLLAETAEHRGQSVADAIPARRSAGPGAFDPAGNRAGAAAGSNWKSPKAC